MRLLDVGCADGALFRALAERIVDGIGIDPDLDRETRWAGVRLIPGRFPDDLPEVGTFDVITMLAVFEHLDHGQQERAALACARLLNPGGVLVLSVPEAVVDRIVHVLSWLHVLDGMSVHEHHGFRAGDTPRAFAATGLVPMHHGRFQLGLNHVFVFARPPQ